MMPSKKGSKSIGIVSYFWNDINFRKVSSEKNWSNCELHKKLWLFARAYKDPKMREEFVLG